MKGTIHASRKFPSLGCLRGYPWRLRVGWTVEKLRRNTYIHIALLSAKKYMYKQICPEMRDNQEFLGALARPTYRSRPWRVARGRPTYIQKQWLVENFWTFGIKAVNSREALYNSGWPEAWVVQGGLDAPPLTKRVRTYIDGCQIGTCFYNCDVRSNRRSHAVAFKPLTPCIQI